MKSQDPNRRRFIIESAAAGMALALGGKAAQLSAAEKKSPVRVGFVGVGARGTVLLRLALMMDGVEIPAICDIDEEHLARAQHLVERRGRPTPEGYSKGPEDFRRLVERADLDAVVTATPWELHVPVMVAALEAGKYGGTEVPAGVNIDELWQLVETCERTGIPCMMLENYCYFRNVMMILNMVGQGLFGDLLHCEVGYQKDERMTGVGPDGELSGFDKIRAERNGNLYPTHPTGPAAWLLNVNRGDRFSYLVSMSTRSQNINDYMKKKFGENHPAARIRFANGDVNTTLIRTENGSTVTLYYDAQSPRPWDLILRVQGSKGIFIGNMDKIYLEDRSPQPLTWEATDKYYQEFEHPFWRKLGNMDIPYGRGVCDYLALNQFLQAAAYRSEPPLDVYDAVTWSVITPLTEKSVAARSAPVDFPDFTRGKWKNKREKIFYEV
ncbi:MAG TPA: Gfo/Idh/MocA family oxidoreductase [archaeon]|nr:Gfo/Idh/MocA family oxidoreductase [archaeon]